MRTAIALLSFALLGIACKKDPPAPAAKPQEATHAAVVEKPTRPPLDSHNIVSIAAASPDHTTLVAAVEAAEYVTSLSNPGPLTVFAPTNAAFDKLPAGTVAELLTPEKIDDLRYILKYHAATSVHDLSNLKDGQTLAMANGAKVEIRIHEGTLMVNDAHVLASIRASNGIVHVIDTVLLPPAR